MPRSTEEPRMFTREQIKMVEDRIAEDRKGREEQDRNGKREKCDIFHEMV